MPDILDDVMRLLSEQRPDLRPGDLVRVEQQARQIWGGSDVYIAKRTAQGKVLRLADELAAGAPIGQAIRDAGLSRRTGYRLLSRRWVVRR